MNSTQAQMVSFEWRLEPEVDNKTAQSLVNSLQQKGGGQAELQSVSPKGILPLAIPAVIFGVVAITALTEQVVDWWQNRRRYGLFIHVTQNGKLDIRPLESLPYGKVLFVGKEGKVLQLTDVSTDKMKEILEAAAKGISPDSGKAAGH